MSAARGLLGLLLCLLLSLASCSTQGQSYDKTAIGTAAGSVLGAGAGAIIGSRSGDAGRGVAIGAGLGALGGALAGGQADRLEAENAELEASVNRTESQLEENRRLIAELRSRGADARSDKRGVVINLPDILFEFDRAELTPAAHRTIDEISDVLGEVRDREIFIEGHTDSIGTVLYNKDLSRRRASRVASKLQSGGISGRQMKVVGYGEGSPIATNNSEAGRARNRRVEVILENR